VPKKYTKQQVPHAYACLVMIIIFTVALGVTGVLLGLLITALLMNRDKIRPRARLIERHPRSRSRVTVRNKMTDEENNQLVSVILPVIRNGQK